MHSRRTLRLGLWGGLLLGFAMPALGSGCRPGEGDRCFCYGECRGGLICSAAGAALREGQCVTDLTDDVEAGVCIEGGNASMGNDGAETPPFWDLRYDLPKTDFAPPGNTSPSTTAVGTDGSTSGTDGSTSGTDGSSTGTDGTGTGTDSATDGTGTSSTSTSG